ncbi:MAG: hypothetical protein FWE71_11615 [Nocardioidaceae bacterium]|nr:hypothetical protein [Nocardioidaceae bacterium]
MSRRILLHVGTPKTGTSYLQDVLFHNQRRLRHAGILYPAERFDSHFLAALDLMQLPWGGLEEQAIGAWDRLAEQVRSAPGAHTVIISHEILARAGRAQVERALASLGRDEGAEVHVVLSVRDLERQIPAEWQENVKHRAKLSYERFLEQVADPERATRIGSWFWGVQEIPDILARWAADVPPEQVHLVTVPRPGSPPGLLWERFLAAFGLADVDLELGTDRSNPSLGVPETALIRRINQAVNADLPPADYRPLVRELLAHQTLSRRTTSPRLSVPTRLLPWVQGVQDAWCEELAARRYDVVGDLADLRGTAGAPSPATWADPDAPEEQEVTEAAIAAIGALLTDSAATRHEVDHLHERLREAERALEKAYLRPTYRLREKLVRRLGSSRLGRLLLSGYRRARRR